MHCSPKRPKVCSFHSSQASGYLSRIAAGQAIEMMMKRNRPRQERNHVNADHRCCKTAKARQGTSAITAPNIRPLTICVKPRSTKNNVGPLCQRAVLGGAT